MSGQAWVAIVGERTPARTMTESTDALRDAVSAWKRAGYRAAVLGAAGVGG